MWHLKTRLGTFWVLEKEASDEYLLGIDDEELMVFKDAEDAASHVYNQETGYFRWDSMSRIKAPDSLSNWQQGTPEDWE